MAVVGVQRLSGRAGGVSVMGEKGREMKGDKGMMDGEGTVEGRMDDFATRSRCCSRFHVRPDVA
jgi:hypothetical protein